MTELIQIISGVWSWGKFTDAKKGTLGWFGAWSSARKFWKSGVSDWLKIHLFILYSLYMHLYTIALLRWMHLIAVLRSYLYNTCDILSVGYCIIVFYLNFYNYIFRSWGNIFWELKTFSGTNGPVVRYFFHPWSAKTSLLTTSQNRDIFLPDAAK
jgi:hypothetical protein